MRSRTPLFVFAGALGAALPILVFGCGSRDNDNGSTSPAPSEDGGTSVVDASADAIAVEHPDASCFVEIQQWPLLASPHVSFGDSPTYNSNPPSSGPHYPVWAAYTEYSAPVDRRYYVHNLEHGGVVFLYKCDDPDGGGCAALESGVKAARDQMATDPMCDPAVRVRAVITPDPLIDTPIAVSAWGYTYKAACVDLPTLSAFVNAHYAQGPENLCNDGQPNF